MQHAEITADELREQLAPGTMRYNKKVKGARCATCPRVGDTSSQHSRQDAWTLLVHLWGWRNRPDYFSRGSIWYCEVCATEADAWALATLQAGRESQDAYEAYQRMFGQTQELRGD